jgi:WD40 repeat protein
VSKLLLVLYLAPLAHSAVPVTAVAFSPDGKALVSGAYKQLNVWDPATGKLLRHAGELEGNVRAIAFRPDGHTVAAATGVPGRSGTVALVDFDSGATTPIAQSKDEMLAVAFSPDGKFLAFGGTDSVVRIWSMDERKIAATIKDHSDWINSLAFTPDGKLLASGSADKTVGIWDTKTWKSILELPLTPTDPVNAVAFSPEGDMLAYASEERAIRVWRTQSAFLEIDTSRPGRRNQMVQTRAVDTGACVPLGVVWAKGPQHSRIVAACSDGTLRMMGPAGNQGVTLSGHGDWVYAVAASPDGTRIASGSGDGAVKLWGPGGRLLGTLLEETK